MNASKTQRDYVYAESLSSGAHSSTTSQVDVTNLSVTITRTGRPVFLCLIPDGTANSPGISPTTAGSSGAGIISCSVTIYMLKQGVEIARFSPFISNQVDNVGFSFSTRFPPSTVQFIDTSFEQGSKTYKLQSIIPSGTSGGVRYCKLIAFEL